MTKPPADIAEYGMRCAEAARDEFVNWESASRTALMLDEKPPAAPSIAAIVAGVPLPEPEVMCEPSGPGWWWARWKSRGAWAPVNVVEREARRDGADVMFWRVQEIGDSWEFDLWEFDAWLPNPAPTTLAPPTAAPETGDEKSRLTVMLLARIKAACRTNEPQVTAVALMTAMNLLAFMMRDDHPLGLLAFSLLCWPGVAFFANMVNPIPEDREQ